MALYCSYLRRSCWLLALCILIKCNDNYLLFWFIVDSHKMSTEHTNDICCVCYDGKSSRHRCRRLHHTHQDRFIRVNLIRRCQQSTLALLSSAMKTNKTCYNCTKSDVLNVKKKITNIIIQFHRTTHTTTITFTRKPIPTQDVMLLSFPIWFCAAILMVAAHNNSVCALWFVRNMNGIRETTTQAYMRT